MARGTWMKRTRKDRGATRTRDPTVIVTVDSGSHINVHAQRPGGEQREPPGRWSVMLGSPLSLLDDLIRAQQKLPRKAEPKRLGRLEVDDHLERARLLNGKIGRFGALEDPVDVGRGTPK